MRWLRLCLLGAAALACPFSTRAQEAIFEDGKPALRFASGDTGPYTTVVSLTEYRGEPAFRFAVWHNHSADCRGFLYVTRTRLAYDPVLTPQMTADAFDVARSDVARETVFKNSKWSGTAFRVQLVSRTYNLDTRWVGPDGERCCALSSNLSRFASLVLNDFAQGEAEFKRLTANLRPAPAPPASVPIKPAAEVVAPKPARIAVHTDPGGVQVYVDDIFKGSSSSEGRLVVEGLPAGQRRLRLTLIGFKEWTQSLELASAEDRNIEAKLAPAGPKPLALPEIEEALTNGVSPKRVSTLVKQFGVDFSLDNETEQRLRASGADSDLLLAIHLNKK